MQIDSASSLPGAGHVSAECAAINRWIGSSMNHNPATFMTGAIVDYQAISHGWV